MPIEVIWIAGVVAAGSCILGSALYSDVRRYRRMFSRLPSLPSHRAHYDVSRLH